MCEDPNFGHFFVESLHAVWQPCWLNHSDAVVLEVGVHQGCREGLQGHGVAEDAEPW